MRQIKFFSGIFLSILLLCMTTGYSDACTIFTAQQDGKVLVGNNEDYFYRSSSDMWITGAAKDSLGRICFANSGFIQGGMNEKGLFYDGASCPKTDIPNSKDKPTLGMDLGDTILSKCSNVDEAIDSLKKHNIPNSYGDHLLLADETGKSVVVEWVQNEIKIIPKDKNYQIATNFFLSKPELGGYPCTRYDTAQKMLWNDKNISVKSFISILDAVKQDWGDGGTKYSNIYDLKNKRVYIFYKHDFTRYASFSLDDELKKLKTGDRTDYNIQNLQFQKVTEEIPNSSVAAASTQETVVSSSAVAQIDTKKTIFSPLAVTVGQNATNTVLKNKSWSWVYVLIVIIAVVIYLIDSKRRSFHKK